MVDNFLRQHLSSSHICSYLHIPESHQSNAMRLTQLDNLKYEKISENLPRTSFNVQRTQLNIAKGETLISFIFLKL